MHRSSPPAPSTRPSTTRSENCTAATALHVCGQGLRPHDLAHYLNRGIPRRVSRPVHLCASPRRASACTIRWARRDAAHRGRSEEAPSATACRRRLEEWIPYNGVTAHQNQTERRRPGVGRRPRGGDRSRHDRGAGQARLQRLGLLARFQRALPQRAVRARFRAPVEGQGAERLRARAVYRAAHRARPGRQPPEHHVRGGEAAARGDRRIAHRTWTRCCWRARWATRAWR